LLLHFFSYKENLLDLTHLVYVNGFKLQSLISFGRKGKKEKKERKKELGGG